MMTAMQRQLGVIMDPLESINSHKDSTVAMLRAAQRRGWALRYMEVGDVWWQDNRVLARSRGMRMVDTPPRWCEVDAPAVAPLDECALVLMRKDPPFDMEYIYATYLLERAQAHGCWVVNNPRTLRDANEKFAITAFPDYCPPSLVTRQHTVLREFWHTHGDIVVKPLDGMGGAGVFRLTRGDANANVIFETLTHNEHRFCMAQRFVPDIAAGDKRILIVAGEPVPFVLARIPAPDDSRGNLAAGARGEVQPLTDHDRQLARHVGAQLLRDGVWFAGLDVIGNWLTEINITSPTCIREIDRARGTDIADDLLAALEQQLSHHA